MKFLSSVRLIGECSHFGEASSRGSLIQFMRQLIVENCIIGSEKNIEHLFSDQTSKGYYFAYRFRFMVGALVHCIAWSKEHWHKKTQ